MLNSTIVIKIKQRINKLDSQDYDNLECWQIVEAFNKAQVEWSRRQLHGINVVKEGDEQSTRRKDDLQVLLNKTTITNLTDKGDYSFLNLPENYLQWKRVDVYAQKDCCDKRRMVIYLAEEGNVSILLRDKLKQPSFEWDNSWSFVVGLFCFYCKWIFWWSNICSRIWYNIYCILQYYNSFYYWRRRNNEKHNNHYRFYECRKQCFN